MSTQPNPVAKYQALKWDQEAIRQALITFDGLKPTEADALLAQAKAEPPQGTPAQMTESTSVVQQPQMVPQTQTAVVAPPTKTVAEPTGFDLFEELIKEEQQRAHTQSTDTSGPASLPAQPVIAAQEPALIQPDVNGEFPTPVDGALWMASLGIAQTVLRAKTKEAFLSEWQNKATTDPTQIRAWAQQYPGCNFGGVGLKGGPFIFEADSTAVRERFRAQGGDFTAKLIVESSPGKGHRYYLSALGVENISQGQTKFKDLSVRTDREYCVSPGSIHPKTGKQYRVAFQDLANGLTAPTAQEIAFWNSERVEKKATASEEITHDAQPIIVTEGGRNTHLASMAGKARQDLRMNEDVLLAYLRQLNSEECQPPLPDSEVQTIAHSIAKYEIKPGAFPLTQQAQNQQQPNKVDVSNWPSMFRSVEEMEDGPIVMVINNALQEGTCFISANPGDGKTLVGLAFAKAISTGTPLFGLPQYAVPEPRTVIYLIPESRDRAFRKRCEAFRMPTDKMKFMARTISAGIPLELGDPYLLEAVRQTKAVVFLDTAARFMKGSDENAAAQNRQLVNDVVCLLAAGAVCVVLIHHATKASKQKQEIMTLENMLRGSSDLGAMCDQAYGIRKDMLLYANGAGPMEIDLVNLKDREQIGSLTSIRLAVSYKKEDMDFPVSYINETGNFRVINKAETYRRNIETLVGLVKADPNLPEKELAAQTGLSEYAIKRNLKGLGWHRIKGGPEGASPWHQDSGMPCPFKKPAKTVNKPKRPGVVKAVVGF